VTVTSPDILGHSLATNYITTGQMLLVADEQRFITYKYVSYDHVM